MRLALDSASLFPRLFGQARPLSESIEHLAGSQVPQLKWIHVASEGMYRGHWQGAFNLTRGTFESFVRNLHQHPQFKLGAQKVGDAEVTCGARDVIQFDYEHASEMLATEGSIPSQGAPAPAWVRDVEVRNADDGSAQLWALGNLGTQIRGQMERNEYRFVSIAFDLEHPNWKTGEDQGPTLTSIAFTNHPFLQDLESYAAANRRPGQGGGDQLQPTASGNEAPVDTPPPGKGSDMNAPAATDFERFRTQVCSALAIRTTLADQAVVDAATEAVASGGGLKAILEGLGVKDAGNALKVIPELMAARSKLAETMAELDQLLQGQAAQDQAMASTDVGAVMSAKRWTDEALKRPLLADRASRMDTAEADVNRKAPGGRATAGERIKARQGAREEFLKEHGVTSPAAGGVDTSHLTTPLAAGKGGVQLSVPQSQPGARVLPADANDDAANGEPIDLRAIKGANPFERVMTYLGSKDPGFAKLPHYQRCSRAASFQSSNQFLL